MNSQSNFSIGIDFGTSNTSAAIFDGQNVRVLPIDPFANNQEVARTILYITKDQTPYIGGEAVKMYYKQNIGRTRRFVKVWVGEIEYRGADMFYVRDVYAYVDELLPGRLLQYLKTGLRNVNYSGTSIFEKKYSIENLVSIYLETIKRRTESLLNQKVENVVLGRPVHLANNLDDDEKAKERLINAAKEAGFKNITLELEPIAAALEYEYTLSKPENIVVFDFGGGTLDITVARVGKKSEHRIFATGGVDIAGTLFDTAIIRSKMLGHFGEGVVYGEHNIPFPRDLIEGVCDWLSLPSLATSETKLMLANGMRKSNHPCRIANLNSLIFNEYGFDFYNSVEGAKIQLSDEYTSIVELEGEEISIWQMITRSQFELIISSYVNSVKACVFQTLKESGLQVEKIDYVVTTGGSSKIPVFIKLLSDIFGSEKIRSSSIFTSVTSGLAIRAHDIYSAGR